MADGPVRVVLLARAGEARDQLHKALGELGARDADVVVIAHKAGACFRRPPRAYIAVSESPE